jgi:hypothetical protein
MTAQILPLRTDSPRYSIRTELDGARYLFDLEWNDRAAAWFFSISDAEGVPLVSGVRVVIDLPLLDGFSNAALPPGVLFAADSMNMDLDPGRTDLGDRVQLVYTPIADIPADVQAFRESL